MLPNRRALSELQQRYNPENRTRHCLHFKRQTMYLITCARPLSLLAKTGAPSPTLPPLGLLARILWTHILILTNH
jgi:hypothetical protein